MSEFLTTDGQSFPTLGAAQAHATERCAQRDGFYICFVQEVRALEGGTWQHFEDFAVPGDHAVKFASAPETAWFCIYNPLTGENTYHQDKSAVLAEVEKILGTHAVATGLTRIYQNTHEEGSLWPYVEVQA